MLETRPSPSVSVTSPEGRIVPTSTPRRGFSKLRSLTQSRQQPTSPDGSRPSPRHYFTRSVSYNDRRPAGESLTRPRSPSRPDASRPDPSLTVTEPRRSRSTPGPLTLEQTAEAADMARTRNSHSSRYVSDSLHSAEAQRFARAGGDGAGETNARPGRSTHGNEQSTAAAAAAAAAATAAATAAGGETTDDKETKAPLPTIRLFPHQDMRNGRQSLPFTPITRTLPSEDSVIRVGRYSEREGIPTTNPTVPSDAPVGFKSKVVSRKHCEFSFEDGQWQIKDVCSSSGTFLNHIRLSQPNIESKLFPVKDGDIVQLGIDFRGGEEMIFRCVKIRIECNRSWQKRPNNFNMHRHAQLQSLGRSESSTQENSGECAICLGGVLPCQSLFVAACAHVWHYKCIRPMLEGKNSRYPHFQCPNCRAWTDLSAEVDVAEEDVEEWMENAGDSEDPSRASDHAASGPDRHIRTEEEDEEEEEEDTAQIGTAISTDDMPDADQHTGSIAQAGGESVDNEPASMGALLTRRQAAQLASEEIASVNGIDMPNQLTPITTNATEVDRLGAATPEAGEVLSGEGPLTPRNNAGPFVFDGSAGRSSSRRPVPAHANVSG